MLIQYLPFGIDVRVDSFKLKQHLALLGWYKSWSFSVDMIFVPFRLIQYWPFYVDTKLDTLGLCKIWPFKVDTKCYPFSLLQHFNNFSTNARPNPFYVHTRMSYLGQYNLLSVELWHISNEILSLYFQDEKNQIMKSNVWLRMVSNLINYIFF